MLSKENKAKEKRVRAFMEGRGIDFVLLSRRDNFAWVTCGGLNHIILATETGFVSLLLGREGERYVVADHIEAPRLDEEKIGELGYEVIEFPWFDRAQGAEAVKKIVGSSKAAADTVVEGFDPLPDDFWKIRHPLEEDEIARYKMVGYDASEALLEAARSSGPGLREFEIEALIAASCFRRRLKPTVILVAAEDRIEQYRHPLPKETEFNNRVMLVLCAERHGLIVNLTRFIYRSALPRALDKRHEAVATVDATAILASTPGRNMGEVFQSMIDAYEKTGFKEEWKNHHQGGPTGYRERDLVVTPDTDEMIQANQALAWNPSIPGAKSEDTILVTSKGFENLTRGEGWPYMPIDTEGGSVERPWPLVI